MKELAEQVVKLVQENDPQGVRNLMMKNDITSVQYLQGHLPAEKLLVSREKREVYDS